ncbi:hypothetical protein OAJ14_08225, partial [Polaribacter sp.]|nr:hypothetical protein [Polaribacter sp.]
MDDPLDEALFLFNLEINKLRQISDPLTQSKPVEVNEIESNIDGEIWIAMEKSEFLDIDDKTFEALELTIQFSDEGDGEHEIIETIKNEMNFENLVFTEYQDDNGEFKLQKVINCPEIQDTDNYGDAGHHGPFSTTEEVVDYLKKLKTINFDELDLYYLDEEQIILNEWNENGELIEKDGNFNTKSSFNESDNEEAIAVPNKNRFNKETSKSSESVDLSGDQKILNVVYPKLKGINFSKVKFGASGNSAAEFFASDIDGDWHYAQSQMIMLFKAFSKNRIESELKLLLNQNEINLDDKIEKTEFFAEHWDGDGFKIEHPVMEGIDIIIITNENMVPQNSLTLQKTDLAPEVKLPTGYENIGIEHVYDGSKFLKANQGQLSLNIPLLFKDNDDSPHYILIGVTTLTLAKRIIDNIIENN